MTTPRDRLTVAAAAPAVTLGDPIATAAAHADLITAASAGIVVFPELSLTGYVLDAPGLDLDGAAMSLLVHACAATGGHALVGAPLDEPGRRSIAMVHVDRHGARIAYRKTHLGGSEADYFTPGAGPAVIDIGGRRVGLGICKDTATAAHIEATAALAVDLYACGLVHHRHELDEQRRRAEHIARTCRAPVVMASAAGPVGGGYDDTAGHSAIHDASGRLLTTASFDAGVFVRTTLTR